jgi:hypothetical protein
MELYYDTLTMSQVDSAGGRRFTPLKIAYESAPMWRVRFVEADSAAGTVTSVDVSDAVAWRAAIDKDFNADTDPMCRTLDENIDASQAADGIIDVLLDAFTAPFLAALGDQGRLRDCPFELCGYDYEGKKIYSALVFVEATGSVDPAGGEPPDPPGNYYTKTEINALFAKLLGSLDIEIDDDGMGLILKDRYDGSRRRLYVASGTVETEEA